MVVSTGSLRFFLVAGSTLAAFVPFITEAANG
jgi:hypothetical protein